MIRSSLQTMHPLLQLVFFACITVMLIAISAGLALAILSSLQTIDASSIEAINTPPYTEAKIAALRLLNAANQLIGFLGASLLFGLLTGFDNVKKFFLRFPAPTIALVPILMLFSLPLIQAAYEINTALIPEGSLIESLFKPTEQKLADMTEAMLQMDSIGELILMLVIVAVLPGIAEEFIFRGVVQSLLVRWFKNIHVAIWCTGLLFSAIHFQFYGFIPRMLLGVYFGYLLVHTKSIWTPILAHFLNNASAVLGTYIAGGLHQGEDQLQQLSTNPITLLVAAVAFSLLFWIVIQRSQWHLSKQIYFPESK
ncbi:MAG: hypothetical protein RL226_1811 [Bacteroidota bacterium]